MPRLVSFIALLVILLLMGAMFLQVMNIFVVPLFLAAVLVVVFRPLHMHIKYRIPNLPRVAALATTLLILLVALLPTTYLGWKAYVETREVLNYLKEPEHRDALVAQLTARANAIGGYWEQFTGSKLDVKNMLENLSSEIGSQLIDSVKSLGGMVVGFAIMVFSLYYFFLDGPNMIAAVMRLSPLDDEYERELLEKFATISRAVVVASLASAVAQGLLAGIGYYFALNSGAPVFLLTMVTMLIAIVPFMGAAAVWIPTALWIYFFQTVQVDGQPVQGDTASAIGLAIYGLCGISAIDNLIKPWVLHGQSNLHPLLAFLSVIGGILVLGPIGILVGPMLTAFIQVLLNMLNKELLQFGSTTIEAKQAARAAPLPLGAATIPIAEASVAGSLLGTLPVEEPGDSADGPTPAGPSAPQTKGRTGNRRRRRK